MNWLTEKLNLTIIAVFLIGVLIGGFAIGIVNLKRPTPLFSKADNTVNLPTECLAPAQVLTDYVNLMNQQTRPVTPEVYAEWEEQWSQYLDNVFSCLSAICDPLYDEVRTSYDNWREAVHVFLAAIDAAEAASEAADEAYAQWEEADDAAEQARQAYLAHLSTVPEDVPDTQGQHLYNVWQQLEIIADNLLDIFNQRNDESQMADEEQERAGIEADALNRVFGEATAEYRNSHCEEAVQYSAPGLDPNEAPPTYGYTGGVGTGSPPTNRPQDVKADVNTKNISPKAILNGAASSAAY